MRLIDAELFRDELYRHYELLNVDDYEVWAVVDVDEVLFNIEEIKAIPIEWIEKWLDKTTGTRDGEDISQLPEQLKYAIAMINLMEMEWEKENEID